MTVKRIGVLGAGTIGGSWAAFFSAAGLDVQVWDPDPACLGSLEDRVSRMQDAVATLGLMADRPGQVACQSSPEDAVSGVDFVQESAIERLEEKRQLYRRIQDHLAPHAIVASSTSFLMPTVLQHALPFADRLLIGHPFNPPHLIPLVEIVGGNQTAQSTIDQTMAFYRDIGKKPILLHREASGHLVNRLQAALWREAIHAVASGLASVEDVDAAVAYGPGLRWALMGPHMTFHMAGGDGGMTHFIDHLGPANQEMWDELGEVSLDAATCKALIDGCAREQDGRSMEELRTERDAQLLQLLKHVSRVI